MSGIYFRPSYSLCLIEQPNTIEKKLQLTEKKLRCFDASFIQSARDPVVNQSLVFHTRPKTTGQAGFEAGRKSVRQP